MKNKFLEELIDKYGEEISISKHTEGVPVISTGSLAMDVSTGIGGVPRGRITEIYGPEGGGKTTICLHLSKNAIAQGSKVLYVDVENSLDFGYVEDVFGFEPNEELFIVVQPASGEDALEIAEAGIDNGFSLVIFDSIAAISPEKELEDPFDKDHVGLTPRLASKFLRRQGSNINKKNVAMVFTNQVRANIGSYLGDLTTPAGHALKHYTSLRIYTAYGGKIEEPKGNYIGQWLSFIIKKNKMARPYRAAKSVLIYGKGIDYCRYAIAFGSLLGVVKTRGSYYVFEDETIGLGMAKSANALRENQELLDKIANACYNAIGIGPKQEEVENEESDG